MSVSRQIITEDIQLKLHFQRISKMQVEEPLRFKTQNARMDFIRYCIKRGENLSENTKEELEQFISLEKSSAPSNQSIEQKDSNKKKLSLLFAHLAAFNYELGDLSIDPVAPAILMEKLNKINEMTPGHAKRYLNSLIGKQIPGYERMSTEEFLNQIATLYNKDGLNFHCYLRENFFQSLITKKIKPAEPLLNYFMPKVFSQQHLNTCVVATQMTLTKKITANFDQLKNAFLSKEKELPKEVKDAESLLISLQNEFTDYLSRSLDKNHQEINKIIHEYQRQLSIIQKEMEIHILNRFDPDFQPHVKKYDNFILSLLHHLITKITVPASIKSWFNAIDGTVRKQLNTFQNKLIDINELFNRSINISKFSTNILGKQEIPAQQQKYEQQIKTMFLNGNSASHTKTLNLGHQLVMNIDEEGRLKLIEHKNSKPEETTLSANILSSIGIKNDHHEPTQEIINSIDKTLERLFMERNNILKMKMATTEHSATQKELSTLLTEKDEEIRNLSDIKHNIQQEHRITPVQEKFVKTKKSLQEIKENNEPKPSPLSLK